MLPVRVKEALISPVAVDPSLPKLSGSGFGRQEANRYKASWEIKLPGSITVTKIRKVYWAQLSHP